MAAYVDQSYYGWSSHEELPEQNEYQENSTSQMLDHGSISFGRYACEPISWEKRSVFTFNKHQEELERFKSHGLVAKKKAYFEEYYKKIRAMKALEESQQTEITLDYSDIGSNTSQAGEEVPIENSIKLVEKCKDEVEAQCGLTTTDFGLSSNNFVVDKQQDDIVDTSQKNLEVNISVNQLLDYSDIGSNTSQTGEEEVPIENSTELVEKCKDEVVAQCGLTTSDFGLSSNNFVVDKQQDDIVDTSQKNLEVNISVNQLLDYGDIGSNTSQTGEEEVPIENSTELVEKCKDEVVAQCGLTTSDFGFSSNNFVVDKQQDDIADTSQKNLEVNISVNQLLDCSYIGSNTSQTGEEEVPIENSTELVEKCKDEVEAHCGLTTSDFGLSSNNFVVDKQQDDIVDTSQKNLEVNKSVNQVMEVSIEEPKQIDICHLEDKEASKENNFPVTEVELDIVTKESKSVAENSSACNVKIKSAQEILVPRKVARAVRKHKDTNSIIKLKEPSAPAKNSWKLESEAKSDTKKSSNAPKIIRKTDIKSGNGVDSSIKTADKVPKIYKSTTASRPFSRATSKRASTSSEGRELVSKTSNLKMSSTVKGKEPKHAQNTSKPTVAANIIKSKKTGDKRVNEDVKKPASVKVENRISLKERDTNVLGSSKIRSSSLPPRDRVKPTGVNDIGPKAKFEVNKCEMTRHESKATEVSRVDTKSITTQGTRQASETKKIARTWVCESRPRFGEQSQNARKNPEQEKPRWR